MSTRPPTTGVPTSIFSALASNADILFATVFQALPEAVQLEASKAVRDDGGHLCLRVVLSNPPRIEASVIDRPGKRLDLGSVIADDDLLLCPATTKESV